MLEIIPFTEKKDTILSTMDPALALSTLAVLSKKSNKNMKL